MKLLKNMRLTGRKIMNTNCGLVMGLNHTVVFGCNKKPNELLGYNEYFYEVSKGLTSTVVVCQNCENVCDLK